MNQHGMDKIELYGSVYKAVGLFFWCLGFVCIFAWLFLAGAETLQICLVYSSGLIFFGMGIVVSIFMMTAKYRKKPMVTLSSAGISFPRAQTGNIISWKVIAKIEEYHVKRQYFIGVWVDNPDVFVETIFERMLIRLNRIMGYPPFSIPYSVLDVDLFYLRGQIKNFYDGEWEQIEP